MKNPKNAFWQALVFTVIVFGIGLILGFFLESYRADKVQYNLFDSEINVLDDQLRNRIIGDFDVDCEVAIQSTFDFADKIYDEALKLESYDAASQFSDSFLILHRRYDLLRTLLWIESVELKKRCDGKRFHTVVYLYDYNIEDVNIKSRQAFYSRILLDLKNSYPDEIVLIPIAATTGLESVELLVETYGISELPSIIIDEKDVVSGIITFDELENVILKNSK
jgi:hypothetical protein